VFIRAIRNIAVGEELSYDYNLYDGDPDDPADCYCRARHCRGTLYADRKRARPSSSSKPIKKKSRR